MDVYGIIMPNKCLKRWILNIIVQDLWAETKVQILKKQASNTFLPHATPFYDCCLGRKSSFEVKYSNPRITNKEKRKVTFCMMTNRSTYPKP